MSRPVHHPTGAKDFAALRQRLRLAGVFEPAPLATLGKLGAHLVLGLVLIVACLTAPLELAVPLIPCAGVVWVVGVMLGHEGAHRAAFKSRVANDVLRCVTFPLMSGMSGLYWRHKHNVLHHGHPNVVGKDPDIEVLPLAIGRGFHLGSRPLLQAVQRKLQSGWLLWVMVSMLPVDLRLRSVRYLVSRVRRDGVDRELAIDAALMIAHWLLLVVLPMSWVSPARAIGVHAGMWFAGGIYLGIIGLSGHTGLPLIDSYAAEDRWELQFFTTRNLRVGPILAWCFVGLDLQIEHHLFPKVSHFRLRRAVPIVRAFAAEHGLPYLEQSLWECLRDITRYAALAWDDRAMVLRARRLIPGTDRPVQPSWGRLQPDDTSS